MTKRTGKRSALM